MVHRTRMCKQTTMRVNLVLAFAQGQHDGPDRAAMDGYGQLFQAVGETMHQSCLPLSCREAPPESRT